MFGSTLVRCRGSELKVAGFVRFIAGLAGALVTLFLDDVE